ncbi:unnamed protein product [Discosporangium mesarthrocarpum]
MEKTLVIATALCATASAFVAPVPNMRPVAATSTQLSMSTPAAKSKSIPFMPQPEALDGTMAGDVGFDPFGFSSVLPLDWLREAELKHGRICQLAIVGWIATDLGFVLPGEMHQVSALEAHDAAVKTGAMAQILLWISAFECVSTVAVIQMLNGSGREAGDFGIDPQKIAKNPKKKATYQLQEITHSRLAMLAFSGLVTQAALTGKGFPYY